MTLRVLEESLTAFPGCAIVITHDRYFLDRVATHILAFEGDAVVEFVPGRLGRLHRVPGEEARRDGRDPVPEVQAPKDRPGLAFLGRGLGLTSPGPRADLPATRRTGRDDEVGYMRFDKLTIKGQEALQEAQSQCSARGHQNLEAAHLLFALLGQPEGSTVPMLQKLGVSLDALRGEIEKVLKQIPKVTRGAPSPRSVAI